MKLTHIISLLVAALYFAGCASHEAESTSAEASATGDDSAVVESGSGEKTAYEGSTGSGLLMERYKTGRIEGYRN